MTAGRLRLGVLGPLLVKRDGKPVELPRSAVVRGLLGVLLVAEGKAVSVDRLIELVWAGRDQVSRGAVYVGISRLREWLGRITGPGGEAVIEQGVDGYRLIVDPDAVDLSRFRTLLANARGTADQAARCRLLESALGLSRGPVLAGLTGLDEFDPALKSVKDTVREATLAFGTCALAAGRPEAAVAAVEAIAAANPLDEPLYALLLKLLTASGRPAEALARYELLRARLAAELGVSPSEEVQKVHLAVLGQDNELARGAPRDPTAAPRPAAPPNLLPADVADFTGRDEQLKILFDLLATAGAPSTAVVVAALGGSAGVGKTALAVHWAHQVRDRFPDGQLHVNLRGHSMVQPLRPVEALTVLLHALGVAAERIPVELDQATGLYRTLLADKRVLVVLDNAHRADQVRPLLPGSPGCLVLVTSRDRLPGLTARDGARRLALDVLTPGEAGELLARIVGVERVRAEPEAAASLARLCAFLPLALRIAAANLSDQPHRSIASYAAELREGNRLAALAVEGDEQHAVRVAFDLSYSQLAPAPRRLFRLLGLVPGPDVTADAAAALADTTPEQAAPLLGRLAGAHLLSQHAPSRFAFHDLLRLYAAELARRDDGEDERAEATHRLLGWYLHTADAAARMLYPTMTRLPLPTAGVRPPRASFDDHTQAMAWLDGERPNLLAAIQLASRQGPRPVAWLLADALRGYFLLRAYVVDWLAAANAALTAAEAEGDLAGQAAMQLSAGDARAHQAGYRQAMEHYTCALGFARQTGWSEGESAALNNLGGVYWQMGLLEQAASHVSQSLAIDRQAGRIHGRSPRLCNLGIFCRELGRLEMAVAHLAEAVAIDRDARARSGEATSLENLGETYHALGRFDDALDHLTQALALHRELGGDENATLRALAKVHRDTGRDTLALELANTAVAMAREAGDSRSVADVLNTVATIHQRRGDHRAAISHHRQALHQVRGAKIRYPEVSALIGLAAAYQALRRPRQAGDCARQALALARQSGYRVLEGQAMTALADLCRALGRLDQAVEHAEQALAVHRDTGHRLGEARTLLVLGHALRDRGQAEAGVRRWESALALFDSMGVPEADHVRALLDRSGRPGGQPASSGQGGHLARHPPTRPGGG